MLGMDTVIAESLRGIPIPPKVWARATDDLIEYRIAGKQWVDAGKPKAGPLYDEFCRTEKQYNNMADRIWFAAWTPEQREEWQRINDNMNREEEKYV